MLACQGKTELENFQEQKMQRKGKDHFMDITITVKTEIVTVIIRNFEQQMFVKHYRILFLFLIPEI